jgi:hypothetical protein
MRVPGKALDLGVFFWALAARSVIRVWLVLAAAAH